MDAKPGIIREAHPHEPAVRQQPRCPTRLLAIIALCLAFTGIVSFLTTTVEIGADEGIELAKVTLRQHGCELYTDIWNDQPPLHTLLVGVVASWIGSSIVAARIPTLLATPLVLACVLVLTRRQIGSSAAWLAAVLCMSSPGFVELSASCMLEIPAMAPALAGLVLLTSERRSSKWLRVSLAGMLFGTALLVKLVPMYLLAVAALATLVGHDAWNTRSAHVPGRVSDTRIAAIRAWITDMLLLLVTTAATFVSLDVLVDRGAYLTHFSQTWASHFGGTKNLAYGSPADRPFHWSALLKNCGRGQPMV